MINDETPIKPATPAPSEPAVHYSDLVRAHDLHGGKWPACSVAPNIVVVKTGTDPFERGEPTAWYRDMNIRGGKETFYLWLCHWPSTWPEPKPQNDQAEPRKKNL